MFQVEVLEKIRTHILCSVTFFLSKIIYFGLMMACVGRKKSRLFKLLKYKIVVFDEVCILYHFNIILNSTGCPLLKKKKKRKQNVG